jgi:HSP20 family protein
MLWDYDILNEMDRLRRDMDSLFTGYNRAAGTATFPLLNAYDDKDNLVISAELPGFTKDQVNITYSEGALTITGKLPALDKVKNMTAIRQERIQGEFEKTLRIPGKVDQAKLRATFKDGILTITLPKCEEAKPKTIAVEAK